MVPLGRRTWEHKRNRDQVPQGHYIGVLNTMGPDLKSCWKPPLPTSLRVHLDPHSQHTLVTRRRLLGVGLWSTVVDTEGG